MTILTLKSPAKVNLTLDVLEREPTGYHRIQTVFHEVPKLYDTLIFEELVGPLSSLNPKVWIELHGIGEYSNPQIPIDETNTILKAVRLLQKTYGREDKGMRIILEKRIPPQSGLGGAASNAATTLTTLNSLWGLNLTVDQLLTHAAQIGMDVPFFIFGGCALGMHYGDHLMPLPTLDTLGLTIEIIPTKIPVSTPEAYAALNLATCGKNAAKTSELVKILNGKKSGEIEPLLHNDFEEGFFRKNPKSQNPGVHLSGTGGALFRVNRLINTPVAPPARSSA